MRYAMTFVAAAAFFGTARAQTIANPFDQPALLYDDGSPEGAFTIESPSKSGDWFSVELDNDCAGSTIFGVGIELNELDSAGVIESILICGDDASDPDGHTPDLNNVYSRLDHPTGLEGASAGFCGRYYAFDIDDVGPAITSASRLHIVVSFAAGDTSLQLCGDDDFLTTDARSYFTDDGFATHAQAAAHAWIVRPLVDVASSARFEINGGTNVSLIHGDFTKFKFTSDSTVQPTMYLQLFVYENYAPVVVPGLVLETGLENFAPISNPNVGIISGYIDSASNLIPDGNVTAFAIYLDEGDLKSNGKPKIKITENSHFSLETKKSEYGRRDDTVTEGSWWQPGLPGGGTNQNWFSVYVGAPGGTSGKVLDSVQLVMLNTDSIDEVLAEVGVYPAVAGDETTPDVLHPIAHVTNVVIPAGTADTAYGSTIVDLSSFAAALDPGVAYHVAVRFDDSSTMLWIAGDDDGSDDDTHAYLDQGKDPITLTWGDPGSYVSVDGGASTSILGDALSNGYAQTTSSTALTTNLMMRLVWK